MEKAVAIELLPEVAELVKSIAARRGKSVEQLVVDAVVSELDPEARVEAYLKLAEKYLAEVEELYAKGDLAQAGEKYWGLWSRSSAQLQRGGDCRTTPTEISGTS